MCVVRTPYTSASARAGTLAILTGLHCKERGPTASVRSGWETGQRGFPKQLGRLCPPKPPVQYIQPLNPRGLGSR